MSNIKPIQINPELFKVSSQSASKNKTLKRNNALKPNTLKKNLLARIKSHRAGKQVSSDTNIFKEQPDIKEDSLDDSMAIVKKESTPEVSKITKSSIQDIPVTLEEGSVSKKNLKNKNLDEDDFTQSINFLKSLSNKKQQSLKKSKFSNFPIEKNDDIKNGPGYGCLKNGTLPTFRQFHNQTVKKQDNDNNNTNKNDNNDNDNTLSNSRNSIPRNKKNVTFKYNLGKKHKVVSVLIKNNLTRKKVSNEHTRLKETKITDMKNYLKRHNLLKSGSNAPPDVIKKLYEQSLLSGDIRNTNKISIVHNYLAE
jgi:hypothetical protein